MDNRLSIVCSKAGLRKRRSSLNYEYSYTSESLWSKITFVSKNLLILGAVSVFVLKNLDILGIDVGENTKSNLSLTHWWLVGKPIINEKLNLVSDEDVKNAPFTVEVPNRISNSEIPKYVKKKIMEEMHLAKSQNMSLPNLTIDKQDCVEAFTHKLIKLDLPLTKCESVITKADGVIYRYKGQFFKRNYIIKTLKFKNIQYQTLNLPTNLVESVKKIKVDGKDYYDFRYLTVTEEAISSIIFDKELQSYVAGNRKDLSLLKENCPNNFGMELLSMYGKFQCYTMDFSINKVPFIAPDGNMKEVSLSVKDFIVEDINF